jgi:hypothetical protein
MRGGGLWKTLIILSRLKVPGRDFNSVSLESEIGILSVY